MTKAIFPVLLAVLALVQLVSCLRGKDAVRMPTKIFLMPFVALAYLSVAKEPSGWWWQDCCSAAWAIWRCCGR